MVDVSARFSNVQLTSFSQNFATYRYLQYNINYTVSFFIPDHCLFMLPLNTIIIHLWNNVLIHIASPLTCIPSPLLAEQGWICQDLSLILWRSSSAESYNQKETLIKYRCFRIIKLAQRKFIIFTHLRNLSKILIFLDFSCKFAVKNDNNYSHFFNVLATKFEFAGFAPKKKYMAWTISKEMVCTSKSHPTKNQSDYWFAQDWFCHIIVIIIILIIIMITIIIMMMIIIIIIISYPDHYKTGW